MVLSITGTGGGLELLTGDASKVTSSKFLSCDLVMNSIFYLGLGEMCRCEGRSFRGFQIGVYEAQSDDESYLTENN